MDARESKAWTKTLLQSVQTRATPVTEQRGTSRTRARLGAGREKAEGDGLAKMRAG